MFKQHLIDLRIMWEESESLYNQKDATDNYDD